MYIETRRNGLTFHDLMDAVPRENNERSDKHFPYKREVCRCRYCSFCQKGKCALKRCCCMNERVMAHACTFTEVLRDCFSNVGDNMFLFRLRIAAERVTEEKSIFLSREHRQRFRMACAMAKENNKRFIAQLYLLTATDSLWKRVYNNLSGNKVDYSSVILDRSSVNDYTLFSVAYDLTFGTNHTDIDDLSNDEVVDFDIFRAVCHAIVISVYGMDAVVIAEKRKRKKKHTAKREVSHDE